MDWPVVAGDFFLVTALAGLVVAPVVGAAGRESRLMKVAYRGAAVLLLTSFAVLAAAWRQIPGAILAVAAGHAALIVSLFALLQLGRLIRIACDDPLLAGLLGFLASAAVTIGPFALGPLVGNLSLNAYGGLLLANPLVTVATAAGIDFLHLDLIYRLSPLAHRGVALPAWTSACIGYAVIGLAGYGGGHLRLRSA